ncbi:MAG: hypothetical protein GXP26_01960 [Planctomycetes bacterium]|nr:hypothetical protein [Planctomycetota bacterium]
MNSVFTLRNGIRLLAWMVVLLASLSITNLPGNWGHSVCGVWGCGPPTQVLVGCHLAWLVVLIPLSMISGRSCGKTMISPQRVGKLLCVVGVSLVMAIVIYQWATWWPVASELQRNYFVQRCGFVIVTSVDIPMLQLLAIGLVMIRRGRRSSFSSEEAALSPNTREVRL